MAFTLTHRSKMASKINPNSFNQQQLDNLLSSMETADKKTQWISKKLKVVTKGWAGRLFWNLIFKRFAWTRSLFGINPEDSKQNLISLKSRIKSFGDTNLNKKYLRVINHFNAIFPHHPINVSDFIDLTSSRKMDYFNHIKNATDNQNPNQPPVNPTQGGSGPTPINPSAPSSQNPLPPIKNRDPQSLLEMTIQDNEPEAALWLLKEKGAKLDPLLTKAWDKTQKDMIEWLKIATKPINASPENLDHFALDVGYGYKSANLMVMQKKTDEINKTLKTAMVKVPPFLPISDFEMRRYIFSSIPEIETDWKKFLNSFDEATKKQFIKRDPNDAKIPPLKITPEGKNIIEGIQKKVINHFADNCYMTPQIKAWLEKEKPELIIVRSTGKEDTENNSNAGGNDSIPFVKPHPQEISDTIGKVLASYFGEKSVSQRLLAGDHSLFTQDRPFLPVLLQVMVMESGSNDAANKDPLDIPRSGVLFTTQKDKAEDVTFIQTGLGNNEGVVTSQVDVDSYFVDKKGNVHTVVKDKKTRFVRVEKNGHYEAAQINNNNPDLQRSQALPNGVVKDLKKVADSVALHYSKEKGKPKALDMEYTVKLKDKNAGTDKPVIYLLQARPLLSSEVKAVPSYLDLAKLETAPAENILGTTVLIDIRNDVRNIESTKQIIFADNLTTALKKYTNADDPQMIKTIVVRKSAPATSHESVVLRPKGVAVLVVEDPKTYSKVETMAGAATAANPLKIDTQRGLIVNTAGIADHKALEIQGLISYPIPREVSIPQSSFFDKIYTAASPKQRETLIKSELKNVEERYTNMVKDLLGGKPPFPFKDGEPNAYNIHRLFDVMATGNTEDAKRALGTLLKLLHAKMHQQLKDVNGFQAKLNIPLFNVYLYALKLSEREILPALYKTKPQSMERLYPIKFLEAAIFQQTGNDIVAADSYARSLKAHVQQNRGLQRANKLKLDLKNHPHAGEIVTLLEMGVNATVSQKSGEEWEKFVADLAKSKDAALIGKMHGIMNRMNELNLLSMGINIIFMDLYSKQKKKFAQVIQEMETELNNNKGTLDWIEANLKLMPSDPQINAWADPAIAGKQIATFGNQFLQTFGFGLNAPNSFIHRYNSSSAIGKLALLEFMNKSVNTYDAVIKQVTGSTKYPADRKLQAKHFAELLEPYFEMMQTSLKLIPKHVETAIMQPTMGSGYSFDKFVQTLKNGSSHYGAAKYGPGFAKLAAEVKQQSQPDTQKLFDARAEFAVASLVVGSKIDLDFHVEWPTSLEEYFTTFHQNMEVIRNMMTTELGLNKSLLSHQPEMTCDQIEQSFKKNFFQPKISYINQQGSSVEVVYNIPLRQHAGFLGVKFNPQKPENGIEITVKMMGNHEHNRWYQAAMFGAWLGNSPPLSLANNIPPVITWDKSAYNTRSVEFTLQVPSDYPTTPALIKALDFCMMQMTMGYRSDQEVITHLEAVSPLDQLDPNFFACTLWGNNPVMQKLFDKHQDAKLAQGIKNTLLAALKYKPATFDRSIIQNYIKQVAARNPEAIRQVITELHANQQLKAQMPDVWNCVAAQKALMVPPQQLYAESIQKKDWHTAIKTTQNTKNDAWKAEIISKMKALSEAELKSFVQTLDYDLKKLFTEQYVQHINAGIHAQLQADILKAADRGRHLAQLPQNLQTLQTKLNNFNANAEEIVDLSKKAMIGLAQSADYRGYNTLFAFESYIADYVGKAPYHYVWDNVHNDTKKLRKGGPLCIIKAMSLAGTPAQEKAFQAVETLINDYLDHGLTSPHKDDIRVSVYALSKAYYNNMDDKAAAAAKLKTLWRNSPEHINHLKGSYTLSPTTIPYNLPL